VEDGQLERKRPHFEVSSGGVVYRLAGPRPEVALIETAGDDPRWTLPKGHVEAGESLVKTAVREVLEETGLGGEVLRKLGEIQYTFYAPDFHGRALKTVHFFLFRQEQGRPEPSSPKVGRVEWVAIDEAAKRVRYDNEREILTRARDAIAQAEHMARPPEESGH
jgi:8-oxo-dGTP pyrophosphatase MutT (NUDIX family)